MEKWQFKLVLVERLSIFLPLRQPVGATCCCISPAKKAPRPTGANISPVKCSAFVNGMHIGMSRLL